MTALQVGAPGERHFGTVKKCYPCCRIKVLPMLPVDQEGKQGAEGFFPQPARLIESHELSQVLQRIKGRSARQINQLLKSEGPIWSDESFDHMIRHAEELEEKLEYIRQNPVKRGLVGHPDGYKWLL